METPLSRAGEIWQALTGRRTDTVTTRSAPNGETAVAVSGGWHNPMTGMGTSADKRAYTSFLPRGPLGRYATDALWRESSMARKIASIPVWDAMREGYEVAVAKGATDPDALTGLAGEQDRLHLSWYVLLARLWERAYGGGAVYLNVQDGLDPSQPLDIDRVRWVKNLFALNRWELTPDLTTGIQDRFGEDYGMPQVYQMWRDPAGGMVSVGYVRVHRTRLLIFPGDPIPNRVRAYNSGWGDSIFEYLFDELMNKGTASAGAATLAGEISTPVFAKKGMFAELLAHGSDALRARLENVRIAAGNFRGIALDMDMETFKRETASLTGLEGLLNRFAMDLSGAADIPATRLWGKSPDGQNATGDADTRNYHAAVRSDQNDRIGPQIRTALQILFRAPKWGPEGQDPNPFRSKEPEGWSLRWGNLWQLNDQERAALRLDQGHTDEIYVKMGVLSKAEVRQSRFGGIEQGFDITLIDPPDQPPAQEAQPEEETGDDQVDPQEVPDVVARMASLAVMRARPDIQTGTFEPWQLRAAHDLANGRPLTRATRYRVEHVLSRLAGRARTFNDQTRGRDLLWFLLGGQACLDWLRGDASTAAPVTDPSDIRERLRALAERQAGPDKRAQDAKLKEWAVLAEQQTDPSRRFFTETFFREFGKKQDANSADRPALLVGPPPVPNRARHPFVGTTCYLGLQVDIENLPGSVRSGTGPDGRAWQVQMPALYGEFRATRGHDWKPTDPDGLDVYVLDRPDVNGARSRRAFVIRQLVPHTGVFDEYKVILGAWTAPEAVTFYVDQYNRPGFFGGYRELDVDALRQLLADPQNRGLHLDGPDLGEAIWTAAARHAWREIDDLLDAGLRHQTGVDAQAFIARFCELCRPFAQATPDGSGNELEKTLKGVILRMVRAEQACREAGVDLDAWTLRTLQ